MTRSLKILLPNFPAQDSFTENVAWTLRAMGHEVRTMDRLAPRDRGRVRRMVYDTWAAYRPKSLSTQEIWALEQVKNWKPDLVLALTLALRPEVLIELKARGAGVCAAWWGDTPANMRGLGLLADGWDLIYLKDAAAVAKFRAVELPAELMHEAANPEWHRPINSSDDADADAVIIAGNYYGYRQFIIERLSSRGIKLALYGTRPPRWATEIVQRNFRGRYIVKEEKSRIFHTGLACLNSTHMSEGDSLNCRAFEICGAGGLQLIEAKPAVEDCYEPGREVLTYQSVDEIVEYLARAQTDRDWALGIREAGLRRTTAHHTYRHRLERILAETGLVPCIS